MKFFLPLTLLLSSLVLSIPTNPRMLTPTTQLEHSVLHTGLDSASLSHRIIPRDTESEKDTDDTFVPDEALRVRAEDVTDEEFVPDYAL